MNKILRRQVNKYISEPAALPEQVQRLLGVISDYYDQTERDRRMLERSMELTSAELVQVNEQLLGETRELRKKEVHLNASQHIAAVGSWEYDLCEEQLYWSDETYRIFGLMPGSVRPTLELFYAQAHREDLDLVMQAKSRAIAGRSFHDMQFRLQSGKIVYLTAEVGYDKKLGKAIKMTGTLQDITERKLAEMELQRVHQEMKLLFENMNDVMFSVDLVNYEIIQMSSACERIYGRTAAEFRTNPNLWYDVIYPEDRSIIDANYAKMIRGKSFRQEYRIVEPSGALRWVESRITPTLRDNKVVRIDGITTDISQRKEAEQAVRDSENKFRSLIQNSADAILILDRELYIRFASDSYYRLMGYSEAETVGSRTLNHIHPEDAPRIMGLRDQILSEPGASSAISYRRLRKDGSVIWCEGTATNLFDEPSVNGIVVNFRDVTERKVREKALQLSNEELRKRNEELDKFVYSVSHDLRAPLASVLGLVEVSRFEETVEGLQETLDRIESSAKRLDGFIADILEYSKNIRLGVRREEIHFDDVLEEMIENMKFINGDLGGFDIRKQVSNGVPFYSDRHRLTIVLNNLLSNAIKYADLTKPDPNVRISVDIDKQQARVVLVDNGIGISPEYQDRIFEMFYRASNAASGSGLGLYIVQETIKKLGGSIDVVSEPGQGTEFRILIPNMA